jgi:hypothetical protein
MAEPPSPGSSIPCSQVGSLQGDRDPEPAYWGEEYLEVLASYGMLQLGFECPGLFLHIYYAIR